MTKHSSSVPTAVTIGLDLGDRQSELCVQRFRRSREVGPYWSQVMEKVDADGNVIGFSVLKVSAVKGHPLELTL